MSVEVVLMRVVTILNFIKDILVEECSELGFLFVLAIACFLALALANLIRRFMYSV